LRAATIQAKDVLRKYDSEYIFKNLILSTAGIGFSVERGESIAKNGSYLLIN